MLIIIIIKIISTVPYFWNSLSKYYSKKLLTREPSSIVSVSASHNENRCPIRREANSGPTRLVRLCIGVKLDGLHTVTQGSPPPKKKKLDQRSKQSLCCKEAEDLQGAELNWGRHVMCDHVGFSHRRREA